MEPHRQGSAAQIDEEERDEALAELLTEAEQHRAGEETRRVAKRRALRRAHAHGGSPGARAREHHRTERLGRGLSVLDHASERNSSQPRRSRGPGRICLTLAYPWGTVAGTSFGCPAWVRGKRGANPPRSRHCDGRRGPHVPLTAVGRE